MTLILMLLGAMMTSVSIVREKERGTMEVLLVSPMNPLIVILGKAVPYMVLCLVDVLIILLLSYGLLDMPGGRQSAAAASRRACCSSSRRSRSAW